MGVRVTVPPRTESSIPAPMATDPRLALGDRPHPMDESRCITSTSLSSFSACTQHVWVATLEDNWGVDMWPALFNQAGDSDLSTITCVRTLCVQAQVSRRACKRLHERSSHLGARAGVTVCACRLWVTWQSSVAYA
eukprot:6204583-Pleurochrysis_carterae.AAC.1